MAAGSYGETLRRPGLQAFLWTQFLGALNDNVLRILVSFVAMAKISEENGSSYTGAALVFPFLLFSGYAGALADRFSKRRVLVSVKVFEVAVMLLVTAGMLTNRINILMTGMVLMGVHSTFFSPAKYGIVPELLPDAELSRANGLLEMSTFAAIVLGTTFGGELYERFEGRPLVIAGALIAIAILGLATSLRVPAVTPSKPGARLSLNPFAEVWRGAARMWPDHTLWMTMLGISYFWCLGTLLNVALLPFAKDVLGANDAAATRLYAPLAIGIATGSLVAGRLSGGRVELGLVPLGGFGMGLLSLVLAGSHTYLGAAVVLVGLGFFGGFFVVPLNALLQQRPADDEKGRVLATNNFFNTVGMLAAAGVVPLIGVDGYFGLTIRQILFGAGVFTILANVYVLAQVPDFFVRFTLWMLTHTVYRIKIVGRPHIPQRGPALIIANHVSMVDGALIGACVQRFVRFLVWGPHFRKPGIHALMKRLHAISVTAGNKREVLQTIERARAELVAGHVVCIFVEGSVSRTGNLLRFKRGFERIVAGLDVPVIPVYLDRVWGSVFSFKRGKFFWKLPERLPYPVTVAWGAPMPSTTTALDARLALMELGSEAMTHRRPPSDLLHTVFMRVAKRRWRHLAMADSTGQTLTFGRALVGSMLLADAIRRRTDGQEMVGLLLPASVGGAIANIAVLMAGRVPVNLNFTAGAEAVATAIAEAGIATIVTSKQFLSKAGLAERPGMVFLEDLRTTITGGAKVRALLAARLLPIRMLRRRYGGHVPASSAATIIFSSGSTGVPKGVILTHANILANVDSLDQIFPMERGDCFIGVLPFFHSFGFTGTMWFPLLQSCSVAYHPNPMDAKTVGELAGAYRASMLISTPTFCQSYLRRCTPEQFAHLKYAIVGAEKLRQPLATAFRERFGLPLLEGYGCTEMAPVIAVNRPDVNDGVESQVGTKFGSVGHPIPGVSVKVVDQDTGEGPIYGKSGMLLVKGPNLMAGYLNQPERTAEVMQDGWYTTGDIGMMDEDGFVFITDRLSRFSKIGGEMVPHVKIEDAINDIIGEASAAVTAVPDPSRGERLVAFYTRGDMAAGDLWEQLCRTELPRLWLPKREDLIRIQEIPTLGTGKVDLRGLRQLALDRVGDAAVRSS